MGDTAFSISSPLRMSPISRAIWPLMRASGGRPATRSRSLPSCSRTCRSQSASSGLSLAIGADLGCEISCSSETSLSRSPTGWLRVSDMASRLLRTDNEAPFDGEDLVEPPLMAVFARKLRVEEGVDDLARQCRADDACADAQHVHVVVFNGLMRGVGVVANGRTDAREFVRGDGDPGATPADDDSAFGMAIEHRLRHGFGRVRVVHRGRRMCTEIDNVVALSRQVRSHLLFQFKSGMIGGESDSHECHRVHRPNPWLRRQMKRGGVYFCHAKSR